MLDTPSPYPYPILIIYLTRRVTVEGKQVHSAAGDIANGIRSSGAGDVRAQVLRRLLPIEGKEVCAQAGDVRGSHGGTRDGVLGGAKYIRGL